MKVVGFGDNVVDRYVNKNVYFPGGNAVNFAVYAKQCGVDSAYVGVFGNDVEADHVKYALTDMGVDISCCQTVEGHTGRADVNLVDGDRVFIPKKPGERLPRIPGMVIDPKEVEYLKTFDLIHSGCYGDVESQFAKLKDYQGIVSFDFSVEEEYRSDDFLNLLSPYVDIALFSGSGYTKEQLFALQEKVFKMGIPYVLVTMGMEGQVLYDGENRYQGRIEPGKGIDTMGAGDSFFTCFLMSLLKSGWKKGHKVSKETLDEAFYNASKFSAKTCFVEGAFGYGKKIHE